MNWLKDHSGKGVVYRRMVQWTVFGAVILLLFLQLRHVNWTELNELELSDPWALVVSICLVLANQFLEFAKWQLVARRVIHDRKLIFRAYWSGVGSAFLTPNGWGSFLGRMIHFGKRDRLLIVGASLQANFSQLTPTLLFGLLAIYLTDLFAVSFSVLSLLFGVSVLLLYFFWPFIIPKKKSRYKWLRQIQRVKPYLVRFQWPMFVLSVLRYVVFSVQFVLLFVSLGYSDFEVLLFGVWFVYLLTAFVPSLWSGKVLIRETAALYVFTQMGVAIPDILLASLLIWLINIVLPAAFSTFVWIPRKEKQHVVR